MTDLEVARERLDGLGARYLWISYHDYAGLARAKAVGPDRLDDALVHGVGWAKANWDLAITDHQVPEPAYAADSGDLRLVPDPATIRPLPHRERAALAYGWLAEPDGTPWGGDPRRRLAAAEEALRTRGLTVSTGIEAEFYFARRSEDGSFEPDDRGRMFSQAELDARWWFLEAVLEGLATMGIAVHQIAKEYGQGQYELSLLPTGALAAVDAFLAARDLIKALARDEGVVAAFMPKPHEDFPGCGLHVHLSLSDASGEDVVIDPGDPDRLSTTGEAAVAGLLAHAVGQTALGSATPNSFKRLLPGSWAPAHAMWAFGNRSALIRIPSPGAGRHLEYRSGDMSANLYLHLTGLLAAIVDGLDRGAQPPPAVQADVGHLSDADAAALGAQRLPTRLDAALDALEADSVLRAALGPIVVPHYLAVKRFEWASYLAESGLEPTDVRVSEWERDAYLEHV
ncbi:MAG TPA: glutamine synthetase family protein [Candidatus Limnocylindrales bacterium]|nr:glutamine synthetase family protein [Candidatus Limnocylindrales bacterium]